MQNKKSTISDIIKRLALAIVFQISIYIVQYIIEPLILAPTPNDTNLNAAILIITTAAISLLAMGRYLSQLIYWLISLPIYYLLVQLYHPEGIYGLDYIPFIGLARIEIWVIAGLVLIVEVVVWLVIKLIHIGQKMIRRMKYK